MPDAWLLVSDLDHTLLGDDDALDRFARWCRQRRDHLSVVYASGRFARSVWESVSVTELPPPRAVIGGVGAEIWESPDSGPLEEWQRLGGSLKAGPIRRVVSHYLPARPQADEFQSERKVSFHLDGASDDQLHRLRRGLADAGHSAEVVYSSGRDLDVLPPGVNKGRAAAFLARHYAIPARRVIVAGDSGNDLSLFQQGFRGVVVGNAHPELRVLDGEHVYHSEAAHADGVREGLEYWMNGKSRA